MVWCYVTEWAFQRQTGWISKRKEKIKPTSASCDCVFFFFLFPHIHIWYHFFCIKELSVYNAVQVQGYYIKVSIHKFQRCGCLKKCFFSKVNFSLLGGGAMFISVWRQWRWLQPSASWSAGPQPQNKQVDATFTSTLSRANAVGSNMKSDTTSWDPFLVHASAPYYRLQKALTLERIEILLEFFL